jgi:hypothetical protein
VVLGFDVRMWDSRQWGGERQIRSTGCYCDAFWSSFPILHRF